MAGKEDRVTPEDQLRPLRPHRPFLLQRADARKARAEKRREQAEQDQQLGTPAETRELLAEVKRRGYRLPGEPTQWEGVTPEEIIRRLQDVEANPQNQISIAIPAGCSVDEITALVSKALRARRG